MAARLIDLGPRSDVLLPSDANEKLNSDAGFPAFSGQATYAVGDKVTYAGRIYNCVAAKTVASATTPDEDLYDDSGAEPTGHWEVITLDDIIGDVEAVLHTINNGSGS